MKHAVIVILDTSVLINFLKISRLDLLESYPAKIIITDHVLAEITDSYPEQLKLLEFAISEGIIEVFVIDDLKDIAELIKFRSQSCENRLGIGECSAAFIAAKYSYSLAVDDKLAIRLIGQVFKELNILGSQDMIVNLIKGSVLSVSEADEIKREWQEKCRFSLKIISFSELIK